MIRYRFKTRSVEDFRPLVDLASIQMPWWCSGSGMKNGKPFCVIICYLPEHEDLFQYWDDAFDIEKEYADRITYTDRFPKPEWITDFCPNCGADMRRQQHEQAESIPRAES